jgi:hypothetical protein
LASFDIVFTTYETLKADILDSSKPSSTPLDTLEGIQWGRIVLDEGNANSKEDWKYEVTKLLLQLMSFEIDPQKFMAPFADWKQDTDGA